MSQSELSLETKIIRYMDLSKFISLISRNNVFYSNAERFEDRNEVMVTRNDWKRIRTNEIKFFKEIDDYYNLKYPDTELDMMNSKYRLFQDYRKYVFIHCWNLFNQEKNFLWKSYTDQGKGLAIVSTIRDYLNSITDKRIMNLIKHKDVEYIDYNKFKIIRKNEIKDWDDFNKLMIEFYKHYFYRDEEEYRFSISLFKELYQTDQKRTIGTINGCEYSTEEGGIKISVDANSLINTIIISPFSSKYQRNVIINLKNTYGLKCKIRDSSIKDLWMQ